MARKSPYGIDWKEIYSRTNFSENAYSLYVCVLGGQNINYINNKCSICTYILTGVSIWFWVTMY